MTMRSKAMEAKYQEAQEIGTLRPLILESKLFGAPQFKHWRVIDNRFPHNKHHSRHHMVVLKRDCAPNAMTPSELEELWYSVVVWADSQGYDYVKFNLLSVRSVAMTPHLHLLNLKEAYK